MKLARFAQLAALATAITLFQNPALALEEEVWPCIMPGETENIPFERPNLADVDNAGPDSSWAGGYDEDGHPAPGGNGDPQGYDKDWGPLKDDKMGPAENPVTEEHPDGDPGIAEVPVTNDPEKGLIGPNGKSVNGGDRDECIEVYVKWRYYTPWEIDAVVFSYTIYIDSHVTSDVIVVCPC